MIDGLDETLADDRLVRALHDHTISGRGCRLLLSAREDSLAAYAQLDPVCWELQPYTKWQFKAAVQGWFGDGDARAQRLVLRFRRDAKLAELLCTPLLCMLACRVWEEREPAQAWTRTALFEKICALLRKRWSDRVAGTGRPGPTQLAEFVPFAAALAGQLWRAYPGRYLWEASEIVAAVQAVQEVRPPTLNHRDILSDLRHAGVLSTVGPDDGDAPHRFIHLMLLEYLVARDLRERQRRGDAPDALAREATADRRGRVIIPMFAARPWSRPSRP